MTKLNETHEAIIARAFALRAQAKANEAEAKELLASLGDVDVDTYAVGDYQVKVTPTKRFDAATAKRNLTPAEFAKILKKVPDSALAKAVLDERYEACQKDYGVTVKIERPDAD